MPRRGNNEGSIYKDKQGHWRGVVTLYTSEGKQKKKFFYGRTKREVTEKVNQTLNDLRTNTYIEPCKITLYEWLCTWLDNYCRNQIRATTLINYETYVERHIKPTIGGIKLCDLSTLILQQFYNERLKSGNLLREGGLSPKTLRNLHNMLHKALDQAVALDMIAKNPTEFTSLPKRIKQERRFFTVDEQQRLQECIKGDRWEMAILLDLYTGMRQGELLGLMWKDVHLIPNGQSFLRVTQALNRIKLNEPVNGKKTALVIGIPKTMHSIRTIPLLPDIAKRLVNYKTERIEHFKELGIPMPDLVFTTETGEMLDPRNFQDSFKRLLKRNGIREVNVHGIRHTFATRAIESGMSIKTLSQILGHSSTAFTMDIYGHVTEELKVSEMASLQGFL